VRLDSFIDFWELVTRGECTRAARIPSEITVSAHYRHHVISKVEVDYSRLAGGQKIQNMLMVIRLRTGKLVRVEMRYRRRGERWMIDEDQEGDEVIDR